MCCYVGGTYMVEEREGLQRLPRELGDLARLEHLNAEENALSDLPTALARLTALDALRLDGNRLPTSGKEGDDDGEPLGAVVAAGAFESPEERKVHALLQRVIDGDQVLGQNGGPLQR